MNVNLMHSKKHNQLYTVSRSNMGSQQYYTDITENNLQNLVVIIFVRILCVLGEGLLRTSQRANVLHQLLAATVHGLAM